MNYSFKAGIHMHLSLTQGNKKQFALKVKQMLTLLIKCGSKSV